MNNKRFDVGCKVLGRIRVSDFKQRPGLKYYIMVTNGDCMNSNQSPIRIKDGDYIICHYVESWFDAANRIIVFKTKGACYIKHLTFVDMVNGYICVKCYYPQEMELWVKMADVEMLSIVDKVCTNDVLNQIM